MPTNQNYEVSNFRLKFGLWYIRHKILFRRAFIIFLAVLSLISYGYTVWGILDIFVFGKKFDAAEILASQNVDYDAARERYQPKSPQVQKIAILPSGSDRADIVISLFNPNEKYAARRAVYRVLSGSSAVLAEDSTFLLPLEEKQVAVFGIEGDVSEVKVIFERVSWMRVEDVSELEREKLNIQIFGETFENANSIPEGPSGIVKFQVKNNTIYNFYEPGFYIFLYNGPDVIGAVFTRLNILESQELRGVEVNILSLAPYVSRVEAVPEINIFDESAFIVNVPVRAERELLIVPKVKN